ncbi:sugar ABC transporter substrate-binding protein [Diaminobutyricibacter tongyongensis]|uniref:Sugar ABC transporter substrate-binding protein n=1 Tax=Leifsonia tongyongensis TaxID=1268043 RepID=A0A6L9XVC9_9MICO|nr:sugar ABC transporter substrate-binding protein [Diaminobutyricibacter tongyongensis]NEN05390.1 sugar ABC transporter substrate-binding protein [Diaminobutyricibacter tongyongensis]
MEEAQQVTLRDKRGATRIGTAILLAGALTALAGCASGGGGTSAAGPIALYTWVGSQSDHDQWQDFITLGKKVDPKLDVTIEGPSFADYWTKVKTRLSGPNPPCLLTTQAARAQELSGLLLPLNDLIKKNKLDTSGFDKSMLKGMTVDGTIRAIPYDAEPIVLYYNADAFTKAGLTLPGATYTRDQFLSDAKKLTRGDHKALAIEGGFFFPNAWAIADGAQAVKGGKLNLTNSKLVDQVQSYFDLSAKEGIAKPPANADGSDVGQAAFTSGNADMLIEGPWMYGSFASAAKFKLGVTIVPSTSGDAHGMTAGSGFGIAKNCKNPDAAFKAIVAMTDTSVLKAQAAKRGIVPARVDAQDAWAVGKTPEAYAAVKALLGNATAQLTTPTWNQVETLFTQYGVEGYRGDKTAKDVLTTIQNSVEQ